MVRFDTGLRAFMTTKRPSARVIGSFATRAFERAVRIAFLLFMSGCASIVTPHAFNRGAHSIKKIALLEVRNPERFTVTNMGGFPFQAFGIIGEAAQTADVDSKSDALRRRLGGTKITFASEMTDAIEVALQKHGYEVVPLPNVVVVRDADGQVDYSHIETDADAILDVWFCAVGYLSAPTSSDYLPWVRVNARMIAAKDKSLLYFQAFGYGADLGFPEIMHIPSNPIFAYGSFDDLMDQMGQAQLGIKAGLPPIAARMGEQLN